jgi:hypothetical protein
VFGIESVLLLVVELLLLDTDEVEAMEPRGSREDDEEEGMLDKLNKRRLLLKDLEYILKRRAS